MINLQATIDGDEFITACRGLDTETMEKIAGAFPAVFAGCFVYGGETEATSTKPAPAAPKPSRKPRAAKEPGNDEAIGKVLAFLLGSHQARSLEGIRPADIVIDGVDKKARTDALNRLEKAGKVRHEGKAGGTRYFVIPEG